MKIRCPVCRGSGGVEPTFASGCVYTGRAEWCSAFVSAKTCPACDGSGLQEANHETHRP